MHDSGSIHLESYHVADSCDEVSNENGSLTSNKTMSAPDDCLDFSLESLESVSARPDDLILKPSLQPILCDYIFTNDYCESVSISGRDRSPKILAHCQSINLQIVKATVRII